MYLFYGCGSPILCYSICYCIDYCLRCVPHDEDTGGFFVATLRKVEKPSTAGATGASAGAAEADAGVSGQVMEAVEEPVVDEEAEQAALKCLADSDTVDVEGGEGEGEGSGNGDSADKAEAMDVSGKDSSVGNGAFNPQKGTVDYKPFNVGAYEKIKSFYGFDPTRLPAESFFIRHDHMAAKGQQVLKNAQNDLAKSVYFIPKPVREFMTCDKDERVKVVTGGVKVFERKGDDYRLVQVNRVLFMQIIVNYLLT